MMDMKIHLLTEQQQKHRKNLLDRDEHWKGKVSFEDKWMAFRAPLIPQDFVLPLMYLCRSYGYRTKLTKLLKRNFKQ